MGGVRDGMTGKKNSHKKAYQFAEANFEGKLAILGHPTPVLLPGKSQGRRSLVGCSPWGRKESDTTERLHFHFSLSCTGEGNGNPLQCSCLENPRDGGAWWAAVYGSHRVGHDWSDLAGAAAWKLKMDIFFGPVMLFLAIYCRKKK